MSAGDRESTVRELQLKSYVANSRESENESEIYIYIYKSKERLLSQEQFMSDYLLYVLTENWLCILYLAKVAYMSCFDDDVGSLAGNAT